MTIRAFRTTTASQDRVVRDWLRNAIDLDLDYTDLIDTIAEEFWPEDVFTREQLGLWAKENGWEKS